MNRAHLRRRILALDRLVNPANSIGAKLAKLSDDQRRAYENWREQCKHCCETNPRGSAYARLLSEDDAPTLRPDVYMALFGPTTVIPADATDAQAADAFQRMV